MKYVAYYRCSTERQNRSGLGLEAQQAAVHARVAGHDLIAEYVECESGRCNERPQLTAALAFARKHRATLIAARLDRLSRSLSFVAAILDAGVEFVVADMPEANRLTLQLLAVMAEYEARLVSERTKAALAAAKCRGVRLGGPNLDDARTAARAAVMQQAADHAARTLPSIRDAVRSGRRSCHHIAADLNARHVPTRRGGAWSGASVMAVLRRSGESIQTLAEAS